MAAKQKEEVFNTDDLTVAFEEKKSAYTGPRVTVSLPALEDDGSAGLKVDQYEHVTIANEEKETTYYIHRGEPVDVPVAVYMVLKQKYPNV